MRQVQVTYAARDGLESEVLLSFNHWSFEEEPDGQIDKVQSARKSGEEHWESSDATLVAEGQVWKQVPLQIAE